MKGIGELLLIAAGLFLSVDLIHAQNIAEPVQTATDLDMLVQAVEQTTPLPVTEATDNGNFYSIRHLPGSENEWPPLPANVRNLPFWNLGDGFYLLDDLNEIPDPDDPGDGDTNEYTPNFITSFTPTTNDLWLQIISYTNAVASLVIHRPWNDTNLFHDLYYTESLTPPIQWQFMMRCPYTNAVVTDLCNPIGFFRLGPATNGNLTVSTNSTALQLAQLLVPPWVTMTNATYTGAIEARGTFAGGNGCGLPLENGVILASGDITNAIGPNNLPDQTSPFGTDSDLDLDNLVYGNGDPNQDAAVLEFDIVSTNAFTLGFQYVFGSEEYPQYLTYSDPMAIFVSTNFDGTNWVNSITNDFALVPGTNLPVCVNNINGGFFYTPSHAVGEDPTNPQYYVDNYYTSTNYTAVPPYAVVTPVFNIQYNGMTVLLTAQVPISANVTNHIKIAIEDESDDNFDSAVFIKSWIPCN